MGIRSVRRLHPTCSTYSGVTGSKYTLSAGDWPCPSTLVCTDAMLGLMRITSSPSSFSALIACHAYDDVGEHKSLVPIEHSRNQRA